MAVLWIARTVILALVLLFSIITLGISADFIATFMSFDNDFVTVAIPVFSSLTLAVSVLTLISLGPMFILDFIRRGAVTSWIMVELLVTGVLMILWLAAAADTTSITHGVSFDCSLTRGTDAKICNEYKSMEAFGFLNWILLLGYFGALLSIAILGHSRGHAVWRSSVRDAGFHRTDSAVPMTMTEASRAHV